MNIDQIIISQLGRQKEMRKRMAEMEERITSLSQTSLSHRVLPIIISCSIAACLAVILFVQPWAMHSLSPLDELNIETPILTEYRSASSAAVEINSAIELGDFSLALEKIDSAIESSAEGLSALDAINMVEDEALQYEKELEETHLYQLHWLRIYALVRLDRNTEALRELESFATLEGEYQCEATTLKNRLSQLLDLENK